MKKTADKLPITVLVMTKNEAAHIARCIKSLSFCQRIVVVDSFSNDKTGKIAAQLGAKVMPFEWNRRYPKKRQWSLDNIPIRTEWVMFVDADEVVSSSLRLELTRLLSKKRSKDAYYIRSFSVWKNRLLRHGRRNNKIVLFKNGMAFFPNVSDEDEFNSGEMEGHYQPLVKGETGQLSKPLIHHGFSNRQEWLEKHRRYARWIAWMIVHEKKDKLVYDRVGIMQTMASLFWIMPFKPLWVFLDSFILKCGFLDGIGGLSYALCRARYYRMIGREIANLRGESE